MISDEELMSELQQGTTSALDELYKRYAQRLYAFCSSTTRTTCPHDAEDIVQDVFLRVIRAAHTFNRRKASFRTWLFRIARNHCIDTVRRTKRARTVSIGSKAEHAERDTSSTLEENLVDRSQSVADAIVAQSVAEAVRDCINGLVDEDDKQAIVLYYLVGKAYREIGEVLGKSTSMARNRVKSAQDKVKDCLERKGIDSVS